MASRNLRQRLAEASLAGRYDFHLGAGLGLAALGLILFMLSLRGESAHRAWHLFHVNWVYFTGLCGGSLALAAVHKITNAKWAGMLVRFAEATVFFAPLSILGLVLIFTVGYEHIYGHMQGELQGLSHGKAMWLSWPWMFGRLFVGLSLLYWLGWKLVRTDLTPDLAATKAAATGGRRALAERWTRDFDGSEGAHERIEQRLRVLAPIYVVVYALVFTLVAFDGIMALQPHWFSNLLGGWYFMGSFLGAHMLLALHMIYAGRHLDVEDLISPKQRHDLGKLCFGFSVFWAYLMWAQFQVIWYANLPEETGFVFSRLWGPWIPVARAVLLGMFVIPFAILLGVAPKKSRVILGAIALVSLSALWLERFLLVVPSVTEEAGPHLGIPELAPTALMLGLFLLTYALFARTFPMISPRLAEITLTRELHHHEVEVFDHEDHDEDYVHDADVERKPKL
jgi:Ni/Fe-hydrogenase subunit HybB-like protein